MAAAPRSRASVIGNVSGKLIVTKIREITTKRALDKCSIIEITPINGRLKLQAFEAAIVLNLTAIHYSVQTYGANAEHAAARSNFRAPLQRRAVGKMSRETRQLSCV